jgi:hypothetical protein
MRALSIITDSWTVTVPVSSPFSGRAAVADENIIVLLNKNCIVPRQKYTMVDQAFFVTSGYLRNLYSKKLRSSVMCRGRKSLIALVSVLVWSVVAVAAVTAAQPKGSIYADDNTIGLWLFDETQYPHTTLTDAGRYEYDLRLQKGGKLVPGKFGNALKVTSGADYAVSYAGFKGSVPIDEMREKDGTPSGLWGPTVAPRKILTTLSTGDWTCEFWLKLASVPAAEVTIVDLGQAYEPGVAVNLASGPTSWRMDAGII